MALSLILTTVVAIVVLYLINYYRLFARNIAAAKASGITYVIIPWNVYHVFWLASYALWLPLLERLPAPFKGPWLQFMHPEWAYLLGHKPFAELGSDMILTVSAMRMTLFVADAEAISQITTRRNDFPKPLADYKSLDLYGKNVVSTEGSHWRTHRKVTAPSFSEKNNELVFIESLHHAQALLKLWAGADGRGNLTIEDPAADAMRFALYIISRAGFGIRVLWPHEDVEEAVDRDDEALAGSAPSPGHTMSYRDALNSLLENILWTQIFPLGFLKRSPFKIHQVAYTAVVEWGKYMEDMYQARQEDIKSGQKAEGMDLFGALMKDGNANQDAPLQKSDILGNAFVIMLAGHETTANALHYSLIYLAMNWGSQKRLQEDIDKSLQGKPVREWEYEETFSRLFAGMAAAVMNETLRILQPVINIPKSTPAGRPQPLHTQGRQVLVPGGCRISLSCAVHKNPKYWPRVSESRTKKDDCDEWRPERWLLHAKNANGAPVTDHTEAYDDDDLQGPSGPDTSPSLFKPIRGAYIPFSEGYRSCMGRRFSQVELLAVLAVIFREYSVELAVDAFASDDEIDAMPKGGQQRREVWQKAADRADHLLTKTLTSIITLQMRGHHIPLRLVKRGNERFIFD